MHVSNSDHLAGNYHYRKVEEETPANTACFAYINDSSCEADTFAVAYI